MTKQKKKFYGKAGIILCLAVGGFFLWKNKKKKDEAAAGSDPKTAENQNQGTPGQGSGA